MCYNYEMDNLEQLPQSQPGLEATQKWQITKAQKLIAVVGSGIILLLLVVYGYSVYLAKSNYDLIGQEVQKGQQELQAIEANRGLMYRNTDYGFSISLPKNWTGYTVIMDQWQGRDVATGKVTESGPLIKLRHPLWTDVNQHEDMPVMVFTPTQWSKVQSESLAVGAAPIPPSLLGQNSKYILALPARYNYDYKTGWEEVDQLVHTLKAFEPTTNNQADTSTWKTYTNSQYGFSFMYPMLGVEQKIEVDKPYDNVIASFNLKYRAAGKDYFADAYSIGVILNSGNLSLEDYYNNHECLKPLLGEQIKIHQRGDISWAGYFEPGTLPYPSDVLDKCGPIDSVADFLSPSKKYIVRIYYPGEDNELDLYGYDTNEKIDALTDQILSTFKFTK